MIKSKSQKTVEFFLVFFLILNFFVWYFIRTKQAEWMNIPPAPENKYASSYGLGDSQLAYRNIALMIQNFGDYGGRVTSLDDYNFEELAKWFFVEDSLDDKSEFAPYIAGYYFGSLQTPSKFYPVLDYLEVAGNKNSGEKWRWLLQAIYIARFQIKDLDRAEEIAKKMSLLNNPAIPSWAKQMPAFILTAKGEKEAAYALMLQILKTESKKMAPQEVFQMKTYICRRILDSKSAHENPLCEGVL